MDDSYKYGNPPETSALPTPLTYWQGVAEQERKRADALQAEVDRLKDALQKAEFDIYEDDRSIGIQGHGKIFCNRKAASDGDSR